MSSAFSPVLSTQLLLIRPSSDQVPLSAAQQAFNRLLEQLEAARKQWDIWQTVTQDVQQRYAQQVRPLWRNLWEAQAQLLQQLDTLSAGAMGKLDRKTLEDLIVQVSQEGAEQASEPAVRAIFQELHGRYAPEHGVLNGRGQGAEETEKGRAEGVAETVEDDIDWDDPEAVAAYVEAQTQAAQRQADRAREGHQKKRQAQQAQRRAQAAQQETKPSVRAVFRKLASMLHPDREHDPQERVRKTALMQRVNQAYEADDLLALLELQWEVEQLDASRLAQMQDAHLLRYNQVLAEQLQQLQQATRDCEVNLAEMLGLNVKQRHAPHKMQGLLRQYAQSLQQQVTQFQQVALHLQYQPETLTDWLRAQR